MSCDNCPFGNKWQMAIWHEEICGVCEELQHMSIKTREKLAKWILEGNKNENY